MHRALIAMILLSACSEEPYLRAAADYPDEPTLGPAAPLDPPAAPPLPSPWDLLTPSELPDVHFVVAWTEYDCAGNTWDGDGANPVDGEIWGPCPGYLAVIDLAGQVIAEFPLPGEDGEDEWYGGYNHLSLSPAGPGRFLVVAETWGDVADADADGFWQSVGWTAWIADAYDGSLTEVARWEPQHGRVRIVESGVLVPMDPSGSWMHVGVWPEDPDLLVLWSGEGSCANSGQGLDSLRLIHRNRPMEEGLIFDVRDLLPEDLADVEGTLWPWTMQTALDEEGRGQFLLGVSSDSCGDDPGVGRHVVSWSPDGGLDWRAPISEETWPLNATFAARGGGAALTTAQGIYDVSAARYRMTSRDAVVEGELDPDRWLYRPGPVLDPAGPTFLTMAIRDDSWGEAIDVHHRGERVWSIDALRFGLQERPVWLRDVILLQPRPE